MTTRMHGWCDLAQGGDRNLWEEAKAAFCDVNLDFRFQGRKKRRIQRGIEEAIVIESDSSESDPGVVGPGDICADIANMIVRTPPGTP